MAKIKVTEHKIEGFADVYGDGIEMSVITFSKLYRGWTVDTSMCFPSNINQAKRIMEAYKMSFEALMVKGEEDESNSDSRG